MATATEAIRTVVAEALKWRVVHALQVRLLNPRVRVKARHGLLGPRRVTGTAHVVENDDARERQRTLAATSRGH